MRNLSYLIVAAAAAAIVFMLTRPLQSTNNEVEIIYDTVVIRDTIRDTIPEIRKIFVHHYDTVFLPAASDSTLQRVTVPIQRCEYVTENYRAVVEGFSPRLAQIELYPQTKTIVPQTVKNKNSRKLQIGLGVGVGYDPFKGSFHPVISIGVYLPL